MVVDEHGTTLGIVTMDDLIADVMDDEFQRTDHAPVTHGDGSLTVDGEITLLQLADDLGVVIEHPDVTTLAGLVMAVSGTIPDAGAIVVAGDHELVVEERTGRKLTKIRIRPAASPLDD